MHSNPDIKRGARSVVRTLRKAGHDAWFVGGCVRDRLLGRRIKEYDIATGARPDEVVRLFPRTIAVGAQFGVIVVLDRDGQYEVATFRAEADYSDGRRPDSVRFVSAREDVLRRDFTINGLLEDPETGEIADFVGGRADLAARVVRAIGEATARFDEDHLRMLRAVRFAATLRFELDSETEAALTRCSQKVAGVAAERIQVELRRMFLEGESVRALDLLARTGLLTAVLPEHGDLAVSRAVLDVLGPLPLPAVLATLLDGQTDAEGRAVADRLKLSREDRELLAYFLAAPARVAAATTLVRQVRLVREPPFPEFAPLRRAILVARGDPTASIDALVHCLETTPDARLRPARLIDGADLRESGMKPGPLFKVLLDAVEDAQIEGAISTRDEAMALVKRMAEERAG